MASFLYFFFIKILGSLPWRLFTYSCVCKQNAFSRMFFGEFKVLVKVKFPVNYIKSSIKSLHFQSICYIFEVKHIAMVQWYNLQWQFLSELFLEWKKVKVLILVSVYFPSILKMTIKIQSLEVLKPILGTKIIHINRLSVREWKPSGANLPYLKRIPSGVNLPYLKRICKS